MKILPAAAAIALACSAASALAADLPSRKGPPVVIPPPTFTWTGFYAGVNIGYGFGNNDRESGALAYVFPPAALPTPEAWSLPTDLNGVIGGGQFGFNYQFSPWLVLGFETDIQGAGLRSQFFTLAPGATTAPFGPHLGAIDSTQNVDWFGTVRGRIGITPFYPRLLIYGTGGFAYGRVSELLNVADVFSGPGAIVFTNAAFDDTNVGWTAGGGVEWAPAFLPNVSAKVEYLFVDLGSTTLTLPGFLSVPAGFPPRFVATHTTETRFHTVRAGFNYHVNLFTQGPIAAIAAKF